MKLFTTLNENLSHVPIVVRYIISGGSGAVVNLSTLFVLTHFFGVWYLISSIVAFLISFIVGFILQRTWTFDHRTVNGLARHTSLYFSVLLSNTFLNTVVVFSLVEYMNIWYIIAQIISGAFIAVMSFFIYRKIFA